MALTLPGSTSYLGEELILVNRCVWDTIKQVFPHATIIPGDRNLVLASMDIPLEELSPETMIERFSERNLEILLGSETCRPSQWFLH